LEIIVNFYVVGENQKLLRSWDLIKEKDQKLAD
jgi:hypothetical protein